jgi:hypothetical protein
VNDPGADVIADGLALVSCALSGDAEAGMVVLRHCDPQMVAAFLSGVCRDLLYDVEWLSGEPSGDVLAGLRARHGL